MKDSKKPPAPPKEPEGDSLERMADLTRRIVAVPKDEIEKTKNRPKPKTT